MHTWSHGETWFTNKIVSSADDIVRFDAGGNVLIGELNAGELCVFSRAGRQSNG